jgi:hypothetical protein
MGVASYEKGRVPLAMLPDHRADHQHEADANHGLSWGAAGGGIRAGWKGSAAWRLRTRQS